MSEPASGFLRALEALVREGVAFVIVGVGGINFYARTPAHAFATLDLDALLEPTVENLGKALRALAALGYAFEAGREPFLDLADEEALGGLVRHRATLSAQHPEAAQLDLLLAVDGFRYDELAADARTFRVAGVDLRVGALEKLLRSKEASGRPTDRAFLEAFEASVAAAGDE